MKNQLLLWAAFIAPFFCFSQDSLTFIGELQYNKSIYLSRDELQSIPFKYFISKYRLEAVVNGTTVYLKPVLAPKEEFYEDNIAKLIEVRMRVPAKSVAGGKKIELECKLVKASTGMYVGTVKQKVVLAIPDKRTSSYINQYTFKLADAIKVGEPEEVSVDVITDYINDKLSDTSALNDLPLIIERVERGAGLQLHQNLLYANLSSYFRLTHFIEPYLAERSFYNLEARALEANLRDMSAALGADSTGNTTELQQRFQSAKEVYARYVATYTRLQNVYLRLAKLLSLQSPFWIEAGANVNLNDGISFNKFTFGIFYHSVGNPLLCFSSKSASPKTSRWSMSAGAYSSAMVNSKASVLYGRDYVNTGSPIDTPDHLRVFRDSGTLVLTQKTEENSFYAAPQFNFINSAGCGQRLEFGISLWLQVHEQKYTATYDYSGLTRTGTVSPDSGVSITIRDSSTKRDFKRTVYSAGVGIPLYFEGSGFALYIHPAIGITSQLARDSIQQVFLNKTLVNTPSQEPANKTKSFYSIQIKLTEKHFGLTLSGDIRWLSPNSGTPFATFALSKRFNLAKF